MLIDLKGPMWDGGFVLIGIRLARKPGLKQGFGQTVFDILSPLRDFEITLPIHTWVFGTEKVCRKSRETEFWALALEGLSLLLALKEAGTLRRPQVQVPARGGLPGPAGTFGEVLRMYDVFCTSDRPGGSEPEGLRGG